MKAATGQTIDHVQRIPHAYNNDYHRSTPGDGIPRSTRTGYSQDYGSRSPNSFLGPSSNNSRDPSSMGSPSSPKTPWSNEMLTHGNTERDKNSTPAPLPLESPAMPFYPADLAPSFTRATIPGAKSFTDASWSVRGR